MKFELEEWYDKGGDDKYVYLCKYTDQTLTVLQKFFQGALVTSLTIPTDTKKYTFSNKSSVNQKVDFYKNDKLTIIRNIIEMLYSISSEIDVIDELDEYLLNWESTPGYIPSESAAGLDLLFNNAKSSIVEFQVLEPIVRFFKED